jgi:two-component system, NarL family, sensor histidine kinase UhpB
MSLRYRLIALVAVALMVSLAIGGLITCFNASRSVRTEMRSALLVGRQTVDIGIRGLQSAQDPQRALDDLVASFKGNRHLRVSVTGGATASTAPISDRLLFSGVPAWFVRLVGVEPKTDQVPVTVDGRPYGTVVIETDPHNEILEVWNDVNESFAVLALFCGLTILLIYLFTGRALRPLDRLAFALERVGQGDYGTRISDRLTPELARLRDSFNRMAERLAAIDSDNRRLNNQLLTLQEEERSAIARDLHDEVSPFLFAINVDLANISRLPKEKRTAELPAHIESIGDAVRHMQRQVRSMLGRLRPIGLAEFGLVDAIANMIEFWQRRHPEIEFEVNVSPGCESLGDLADTTIYRIVQESVSNAVRHGKPASIAVSVRRTRGQDLHDVIVEVSNDGQGMREAPIVGYGLLGMKERAMAMGGHVTFFNRPGGGFAVTSVLPCAAQRGLATAPTKGIAP